MYLAVADGKSLPFSDESFDLMLSNHWLQYCGDARAHIKEAYRVLQKGGTMGVGVVGRKENSKSIFILADAMKENGVEIEYDSMMFLLGDEGHLKGIFEEEGFEVSKCFYHTMNISANKEEFLKFLVNYNPYKEKWDELSERTKNQYMIHIINCLKKDTERILKLLASMKRLWMNEFLEQLVRVLTNAFSRSQRMFGERKSPGPANQRSFPGLPCCWGQLLIKPHPLIHLTDYALSLSLSACFLRTRFVMSFAKDKGQL